MAEDTTKVYALDEGKNQHETMTREQIITAIENMESTGSVGDVDDGFISKIKELNESGLLRFWVGTMAEYTALEEKEDGVLYLFSDDPTIDDLESAIDSNESSISAQGQEIDDLQSDVAAINARIYAKNVNQAVSASSNEKIVIELPASGPRFVDGNEVSLTFEIYESPDLGVEKVYTYSVTYRLRNGVDDSLSSRRIMIPFLTEDYEGSVDRLEVRVNIKSSVHMEVEREAPATMPEGYELRLSSLRLTTGRY